MSETGIEMPLDQLWYERFKEIGSFQAYEYFDGDRAYREVEKQKFLRGEIENPTLDYPKLSEEDLVAKETALIALKKDMLKKEANPLVSQAYRWKLNEKIAEIRMLEATLSGDMRRFKRYSEFIYGKPSVKTFSYSVAAMRGSEISGAHQLPSEQVIMSAQKQTLRELGSLIDVPQRVEEFTAEGIKSVFERALASLKAQDWKVMIDMSSKSAISVNQEEQTVQVPESRKLLFEKLRGLVVHEIGTHVARRIYGERSKLHILGLGLDRYEKGEEGVATMREQAIMGKVENVAGLDKHYAIGLALGFDGQPRNFREVYESMYKLYREFYRKDDSASAQNKAWNTCVRVFRGTDCKTPGVAFTKDSIYTEGNIGVWDVIRDNPAEMMRFSIGKYDPTNPRHLWILDQLGITDEDLAFLEEPSQNDAATDAQDSRTIAPDR